LAAAPASGNIFEGRQYPSDAVKFSVNGAGNVHSYGTVTADGNVITGGSFHYATPRTRVISIPSEAFLPTTNVDYDNIGNAVDGYGAHLMSGTGAMAAPVQLPQGAVVTQFQLWLYDNSSSNLDVDLFQCDIGNGWGTSMAGLNPTGWPGYGHLATTSISPSTIDNTAYTYMVSAGASSSWDADNLRVLAMIIWYTEADAE
jgi:hypothetical protein